jgi:hypothetical protein
MKKLIWLFVILILLGGCAWYFLNYLVWRIPPPPETHVIALADLDGDGDLDAFLANGRNEGIEPNTVLWNDGNGRFQDSGQRLGSFESRAVTLRDFDNDGDTDALVSNISWGEYFWNDGRGQFQQNQLVSMPGNDGFAVGIWRFEAADLNGDNQVDLFLTGCCGGGVTTDRDGWQTLNAHNTVWLNDGQGLNSNSGQKLGLGSSEAVALADLDGDGDLDAFVANSSYLDEMGDVVDYDVNRVWLNDGQGIFRNSEQQLGDQRSHSVALGDLDGDGDLDALVGNRGPDEVWWNDGQGYFSDSDQALGNAPTRYLYLADLDGDGDLDAFLGSDKQGRIWLNDGRGFFTDSGQRLNYSSRHAVALGDVDGNGTMDVVAGKLDRALVWLNDGLSHGFTRWEHD